ncbi:putative plant UBX domain-containing protein 14 [Cardamine amara subsp. amara]|uniref:Plant UBX domain-containing protein 14 n=1 Tax=Cardamine amara subsp. amara TaxID=228776 RepID=A0ABD0ZUW1_CARAN
MESAMRNHQRQIISKFQEISVGQPEEIASQFLKATCWKLEEAINLFLTERTNPALMFYEEEQINLPLILSSYVLKRSETRIQDRPIPNQI